MTEEELREKIAELEHEQWSHWFKYMRDNGTMENIARWCVQAETDYQDLSEKEKDSDRKWADIVLTLIKEAGWKSPEEVDNIKGLIEQLRDNSEEDYGAYEFHVQSKAT